jgi:leucine efflux protein
MSTAILTSFIAASFLVIIAPGPATLFILRRCDRGLSEPLKGVAGIAIGDIVMIGLSCLGVAALVIQFPGIASAMRLAGAAYVGWLGWQTLQAPAPATSTTDQPASGSSFAQGLFLTLANPKPILFFAAFFPLFMTSAEPPAIQVVRLGALFEAINLGFYALFIGAARLLLRRMRPSHGAIVSTLSGLGLLLAGVLGAAATIIGLGR